MLDRMIVSFRFRFVEDATTEQREAERQQVIEAIRPYSNGRMFKLLEMEQGPERLLMPGGFISGGRNYDAILDETGKYAGYQNPAYVSYK